MKSYSKYFCVSCASSVKLCTVCAHAITVVIVPLCSWRRQMLLRTMRLPWEGRLRKVTWRWRKRWTHASPMRNMWFVTSFTQDVQLNHTLCTSFIVIGLPLHSWRRQMLSKNMKFPYEEWLRKNTCNWRKRSGSSICNLWRCTYIGNTLMLKVQPLLLSNRCCGGSLLRGPQCHCWDHCSVRLCLAKRVLFDSPVYTWSQLLQGVWYTNCLLLGVIASLSPGFRVHAGVKMERMSRGARIPHTPTIHSRPMYRGCPVSSVALLVGIPLLVVGRWLPWEEEGGLEGLCHKCRGGPH